MEEVLESKELRSVSTREGCAESWEGALGEVPVQVEQAR